MIRKSFCIIDESLLLRILKDFMLLIDSGIEDRNAYPVPGAQFSDLILKLFKVREPCLSQAGTTVNFNL